MCANRPLTGFMNMFFQTSAETVGMTKNGAITRIRTMPCPQMGWSSSSASAMPPTMVISSTPPTSSRVLVNAREEGRVGEEELVVQQTDPVFRSPGVSRL